jgi:hypothetical protein
MKGGVDLILRKGREEAWGIIKMGDKIYCVETLNPKRSIVLKPFKYSGNFNVKKLSILPTVYLCVPYDSQNKQRLFP